MMKQLLLLSLLVSFIYCFCGVVEVDQGYYDLGSLQGYHPRQYFYDNTTFNYLTYEYSICESFPNCFSYYAGIFRGSSDGSIISLGSFWIMTPNPNSSSLNVTYLFGSNYDQNGTTRSAELTIYCDPFSWEPVTLDSIDSSGPVSYGYGRSRHACLLQKSIFFVCISVSISPDYYNHTNIYGCCNYTSIHGSGSCEFTDYYSNHTGIVSIYTYGNSDFSISVYPSFNVSSQYTFQTSGSFNGYRTSGFMNTRTPEYVQLQMSYDITRYNGTTTTDSDTKKKDV